MSRQARPSHAAAAQHSQERHGRRAKRFLLGRLSAAAPSFAVAHVPRPPPPPLLNPATRTASVVHASAPTARERNAPAVCDGGVCPTSTPPSSGGAAARPPPSRGRRRGGTDRPIGWPAGQHARSAGRLAARRLHPLSVDWSLECTSGGEGQSNSQTTPRQACVGGAWEGGRLVKRRARPARTHPRWRVVRGRESLAGASKRGTVANGISSLQLFLS